MVSLAPSLAAPATLLITSTMFFIEASNSSDVALKSFDISL